MDSRCAVILAAGDGKRMKSSGPKVLCKVLFEPMINWVLSACQQSGINRVCAVVGCGAEEVKSVLPQDCTWVMQQERRGTGHAAGCAANFIGNSTDVLILNGDSPFISSQVIEEAYKLHKENDCGATVITAKVPNPTGYGRIIREGGLLTSIVEEREASEEIKKISEINSGAYWFRSSDLLDALGKITCENTAGEYYLTDALSIIITKGSRCQAYCSPDYRVVEGANDRMGLAMLNTLARDMKIQELYECGVDIPLDDGIIIGRNVRVGSDTTILPGTILKGNTVIGSGCVIGPGSYIEDSTIGCGCKIKSTYITSSVLEDDVQIGPFAQVRPGSKIGSGCRIGNFNEIKNSQIGQDTKMSHLSYCGDADVGSRVNFGCGTVIVNYNGVKKNRTLIGDDAFIGCNSNLVAPIKIGNGAYTAAGSTVTQDVPDNSLAIGRSRDVIKEGYVPKLREKFKE